MEYCIEVNPMYESELDKFINKYLEKGYKFKKLFQRKGKSDSKTYYVNYVIFIKP